METLGELLAAPASFCLAISYNPGYQSMLKDLKQSTRQRFVALELNYPDAALEQRIVAHEAGIDPEHGQKAGQVCAHDRQSEGSGAG